MLIFLLAPILILNLRLTEGKICSYSSCECSHFLDSEVETLFDFKNHIYSDPFDTLHDWQTNKTCQDGWTGVCCDKTGRVSEMYLSGKGLRGSISIFLGNLSSIRYLNLSGNALEHLIPSRLGKLESLIIIDLSGNTFIGAIPEELSGFSNLKTMDFSGNSLTFGVPVTFGSLSSLEKLALSNNSLNGTIPDCLSLLGNLTTLDLSNNIMSGPIPESLGHLSNLKELKLAGNYFNQTIPATFQRLCNASNSVVDFSSNCLTSNSSSCNARAQKASNSCTAFYGTKAVISPTSSLPSSSPQPPPVSAMDSHSHSMGLVIGIALVSGFLLIMGVIYLAYLSPSLTWAPLLTSKYEKSVANSEPWSFTISDLNNSRELSSKSIF